MDDATRKKLAARIFEETGIAVEHNDPVFAISTISQEAVKDYIEGLRSSIEGISDQFDEKLQERISIIDGVANKLESGAQQQAVALSNQVKVDAESVRKTVLEALQKDIGSATYQLNLAAIEANRSYNKPWWLIGGAGVLFLVASFISGVGGMMLYNAKTVELLTKERDYYMLMNGADARADKKTIAELKLSPALDKKYHEIYSKNYTEEFSDALKRAGLSGFLPEYVKKLD